MSGGSRIAGTLVSTWRMGTGRTQEQRNVDVTASTGGIGVSQLCTTQTNDPEGYFGRNKYLIII